MSYALIRSGDNALLAGPLDEEPAPGPGERVVVWCLGCAWSQTQGGFVDASESSLLQEIDRAADVVSAQFVDPSIAMIMRLLRKESEARAWFSAARPLPKDFPFLDAEATVTGVPIGEVAAAIVAEADALTIVGARIEGRRMAARAAVARATDDAAKVAAAKVDWKDVADQAHKEVAARRAQHQGSKTHA